MLDSTVCTVVGKWGGSQDRLRHLTGAAAAGAPEGVHAAAALRAGEAAAAPRAGEALRAPHTLDLVTLANGRGLPDLRCVAVRGGIGAVIALEQGQRLLGQQQLALHGLVTCGGSRDPGAGPRGRQSRSRVSIPGVRVGVDSDAGS